MKLAVLAADVGPGARALLSEALIALRDLGWSPRLYWDSPTPTPSGFPAAGRPGRLLGRRSRAAGAAARSLRAAVRSPALARVVRAAGDAPPRRTSRRIEAEIVAWRPDLLHVVPASLACRRRLVGVARCPVAVTLTGAELAERPTPREWAPVWQAADGAHLLSTSLLEPARAAGLPDELPLVVGGGAPAALRLSRSARSQPDWPLRVLSAGQLRWSQGHEHAVQAIAELAERRLPVEYRVFGAGPHSDAVLFAAASLGIENRVSLLGDLSTAMLRTELEAAEAVLEPAIAPVTSPIETAALEQGIPLVTTGREGRAASGNVIGVPAGDASAIAGALAEIIDRRGRPGGFDGRPAAEARRGRAPDLGARQLAGELDGLYLRLLAQG